MVGAAALAAATAFSGTASATVFPCSASPSPTPGSFGTCVFSGNAGVGFNILGLPGGDASPSSDSYTFDFSSLTGPASFHVSFTSAGVALSLVSFNGGPAFTPVFGQTYVFDLPSPGSYTLDVTGTGIGSYTGSFALAVPEPAMWGMMIGGFALCGAALRRRRKPLEAFA